MTERTIYKKKPVLSINLPNGTGSFYSENTKKEFFANAVATPDLIEENIQVGKHKVTIEIFTDPESLERLRPIGRKIDFAIVIYGVDLFYQRMLGMNFHPTCDIDFADVKHDLTSVEKAITSIILYSNQSVLLPFVVYYRLFMCIAQKHGMSKVFTVLD